MKSPKNTKLEINAAKKNSTTKCEKDFACLNDDGHELCPVDYFYQDKILFIKCLSKGYCSYRISFGYASYICSCPMRKEIYRKYSR
jgi:hypothetical protein